MNYNEQNLDQFQKWLIFGWVPITEHHFINQLLKSYSLDKLSKIKHITVTRKKMKNSKIKDFLLFAAYVKNYGHIIILYMIMLYACTVTRVYVDIARYRGIVV